MRSTTCLLPFLLAAAGLPAQFGFRAGDLFLFRPTTGAPGNMLVRIDPLAPTTTTLLHLQYSTGPIDTVCYDPARDRLLVSNGIGGPTVQLWAVDSFGNAQSLGHANTWIGNLAPRGDGIVYCRAQTAPAGEIQYLDATANLHTLLDATGSAPFAAPPFGVMAYHPGENALFLAEAAAFPTGACTGSYTTGVVNVRKVPLSASGTQVAGPVTCATIDVSTSTETVVSLSLMADGDLLLVVDTNSNMSEPRMLRVTAGALALTPFAHNGPYVGAAATNAGCWSHAIDAAVIVDTGNDVLRAFSAGQLGGGATLPPLGVSPPGSSGEVLKLFEIGPAFTLGTMTGSPRQLSLSAGGSQTLSLENGGAGGASYWILGSISGWNPGLTVGPTQVWVVFDFYTSNTITFPNSGYFTNTLGSFDANGEATASVNLPPGLPAILAGITVHHSALVLGAAFQPIYATNPVSLLLVP
ncbi:MAG: hypothetical protein KDC48_14610 [Planctomycetes bacterium]|nr:hypothetical protein [Planctomycetota bacterium]